MKVDEDLSLVQACTNGDTRAFEALFQKYNKKVAGFARKFLGDAQHAEDIVQEVFLQVFRKILKFRGEASFSTWLFRITVNACKSKLQTLTRQRRLQEESPARRPERSVPTPEAEFGMLELRAEIEGSLESLGEEQRAILLMKTVRKLSYIEIGQALNQSETQVRGKLYRARRAFRVFIDERRPAA